MMSSDRWNARRGFGSPGECPTGAGDGGVPDSKSRTYAQDDRNVAFGRGGSARGRANVVRRDGGLEQHGGEKPVSLVVPAPAAKWNGWSRFPVNLLLADPRMQRFFPKLL